MKPSLFAVIVLAVAACDAPPARNTLSVSFAGGSITSQIAATGPARDTGLMNRTMLGANDGMLFVFPSDVDPARIAFWMKDTPIPLSIAFMDAGHRVLDVQEMVAFDTITFHRPRTLYRFALEANKGWFNSHGVAAGATASFSLPSGLVISP